MKKPSVVLGSDHAGFACKESVKDFLEAQGILVEDAGTFSTESVDYPDYAERVCLRVRAARGTVGILSCGTGIGAAISANKIPGIRAALVRSVREARLSRQHNDANVLVVAGRPFNRQLLHRIVRAWLTTPFEGGRHLRRIRKIRQLERRYSRRASV